LHHAFTRGTVDQATGRKLEFFGGLRYHARADRPVSDPHALRQIGGTAAMFAAGRAAAGFPLP